MIWGCRSPLRHLVVDSDVDGGLGFRQRLLTITSPLLIFFLHRRLQLGSRLAFCSYGPLSSPVIWTQKHFPVVGRDQNLEKKSNAMLPSSLSQTTMKVTPAEERFPAEEAVLMVGAEEEMSGKPLEIGDPSPDRTMGKTSSLTEGPTVLHWGHRKRPRCNRVDNPKHSTITDEPAVLVRKTVRVKAEKVVATEMIKVKNGMRERPRLPHPEVEVHTHAHERRKRAKILRGGALDPVKAKMGTVSKEVKGAVPSHNAQRNNSHLSYVSKTRTSPDHNMSLPCRSVIPMSGSIEITAANIELDWPKFLISLSRKEKEDDFFMIKGTKLPQRPKRRPKVVERALHFCTPGSWLTDLSRGRYDVQEKKCVKKKPRGLKAMESMDSDSE
ncbi:hypothetical protein GOP47_0025480 [Adiantum capillus-veneris]|uniref:Uncharacterized protein n=1 Tax=Adiantum capillus-veneris TaxID=13818 RepID=A0A9D4U2U7_ADICA|nr:hypothetical protein GOP47_0025480 [Adiantum capillus-veneris]